MSGDERYGDEVVFFEWRRLARVIKTIAKVHTVVIRKQTISTVRERINYMKRGAEQLTNHIWYEHTSYTCMHSLALRQTRMRHQPVPDGDETAGQHIYSPTAG